MAQPRKSTIIKTAGSSANPVRASISQHKGSTSRKGRDRAKSTVYGGLQVQVNGKNMTPLPLLKRTPFDFTANDDQPFIPQSEPGSPDLPMPINFAPRSSIKVSESPQPLSPKTPGSGGRAPTSLRRQSSRTLNQASHEIKRSLSFSRSASKTDAALQQQQQQQQQQQHGHLHGHGHGHKNDEPTLPPGMTKEDLVKPVSFSLTESSTITLLHIASSCVASDDSKLNAIKTKNAQYAELCAAKEGSDKYVARAAQTFNPPVKDKETNTLTTSKKNATCLAIGFAIEDDYRTKQMEDDAILAGESKEKESEGPREFQREVSVAVDVALATPGALLTEDKDVVGGKATSSNKTQTGGNGGGGRISPNPEPWSARSNGSDNDEPNVEEMAAQQLKANVLKSKNLENALHTVERAVMQNMYHARQLRYRGLPNAVTEVSSTSTGGGGLGDDLSGSNAYPQNNFTSPLPPSQANLQEVMGSPGSSPGNTLVWSEGTNHNAGQGSQTPTGGMNNNDQRNATDISVSDTRESKSRLWPLFDFICSETKGRPIHTMSFNKTNSDVLAVAYGSKVITAANRASTPHSAQHSISSDGGLGGPMGVGSSSNAKGLKDEGGLVAFWSLRNPQFPERLIHTVTGVTALDFSSRIPNLLAVGLQDGTVAIYNMKRERGDLGVPILDSSSLSTKHMEAVWQVKWVDKGTERGECLVSVSTDGRIAEWSMKKGLASSTLMVLRRSGNAEGSISRTAAGLSFDFPIGDPNTYFAGAEDGTLHRCSCSYTEQSLDASPGHAGPIYRVRCSPKHPAAILTCGADWSVKLWHKGTCVQTFHPGDLTDAVHDVCWSPLSSTVFASVAGDGRVEVWDLAQSKLDPSISMFCDGTVNEDTYEDFDDPDFKGEKLPSQTAVLFAPTSKVLLVGDDVGRVKLYEMQGIDLSDEHSDPQRLISAMGVHRQA